MKLSNSYENLLKNLEELDALVAFYQKVKDEPVADKMGSHHSLRACNRSSRIRPRS